MTYALILVVIGLGAGNLMDSPKVPTPVSTQLLQVGSFTSQAACQQAATEGMKANGPGSPGASYRLLCIRSSDGKAKSPG